MLKKILVLQPSEVIGSPAYERVSSFILYFEKNGVEIVSISYPHGLLKKIKLLPMMIKGNFSHIFISCPPFRFFPFIFLPNIHTILDIRDGWSIAIKNGYGGVLRKRKFAHLIARGIERLALYRSSTCITCTPGLKNYLEGLTNKKIILIPNGISEKNLKEMRTIKLSYIPTNNKGFKDFVCAGKFSEYGINKAKSVIRTISERYKNHNCRLYVIGADKSKNSWINDYILKEKITNLDYFFIERLSHSDLYAKIADADIAISIVREPSYEFGTKVFEYIALDKPILNYFSEKNQFTEYFDGIFDINFDSDSSFPTHSISREYWIEKNGKAIMQDGH